MALLCFVVIALLSYAAPPGPMAIAPGGDALPVILVVSGPARQQVDRQTFACDLLALAVFSFVQFPSAVRLGIVGDTPGATIEAVSHPKLVWANLEAATLPSFAAMLNATIPEPSAARAVVCIGCDDAGICPAQPRRCAYLL
jgi:hypothetical protein